MYSFSLLTFTDFAWMDSRQIFNQYFPEFKCLMKLAWPLMLMNLFRFFNQTISVIMCGHLRKTDLDASSLANSLISVFGTCIDLGFSTACDTLFAQVYGSQSKRKLGLMLQRAILVMTIIYLLLASIHLNIEPFLILLSQDVEISRLASKYVALYLPGLFFDFQFLAISRYLENQNIVYPAMISAFIGCVFNTISQYVAIHIWNFGIEASAIIQGSTCFVMFIIQLMYLLISKVYKSTWQGFEFKNAILGWESFFKLGIPGIVMMGAEEWTFEMGTFVAGSISDVQLGAHSIGFQIAMICDMVHAGLSTSLCIRSGQHLGANRPMKTLLTAKAAFLIDFMISMMTFTVIISFKKHLPYVFTNDEEIRHMGEKMLNIVCIIRLVDCGFNSSAAILRACGRQFQCAIVMFTSYYCLGLPLGIILIYVFKIDIRGFWLSLMSSYILEIIVYLILVYRINWQVEAEKAQIRIKESELFDSIFDHFTAIGDSEKINLMEHEVKIESKKLKTNKTSDKISVNGILDGPKFNSQNDEIYQLDDQKLTGPIIFKRTLLCSITIILFLISVFVKIYLPRGYYIPCIKNNSSNLPQNKNYPFCNDTMFIF